MSCEENCFERSLIVVAPAFQRVHVAEGFKLREKHRDSDGTEYFAVRREFDPEEVPNGPGAYDDRNG